jgi:hypothetical protein
MHLTPTSRSWLNQVKRLFTRLAQRRIRPGIHRGVAALKNAVTAFTGHEQQ